jgi:predicted TPR repeat methyltransferase
LEKLGRDDDALASYEKVLKIDPNATDAKNRIELIKKKQIES